MTEYIKRDDLYDKAYWHGSESFTENPDGEGMDAVDVIDIDNIEAADVVEVVRCKNCEHYSKDTGECCIAYDKALRVTDEDFCSQGERVCDSVYADDITGTIGEWLDKDFDDEIPASVIGALKKAYKELLSSM